MKRKIISFTFILILLTTLTIAVPGTSNETNTPLQPNLTQESKPNIVLFYSPTCPHCDHVEEYLQTLNSSQFTLEKYKASQHSEKFSNYIENHSISARYAGAVPTVFIDENSAVGSKNSIQLIEEALNQENNLNDNKTNSNPQENNEEDSISNLGILGLIGLAATDSINPCALAVLLILVSSIMSGNLKDQIRALKSGASFTAGIFLSYLAMGILLVFGIKSVQKATSLNIDSIYLIFGGFAIFIGLLNLKDWISHGFGGFVMEVPYNWRPKMKSYLKKVTGPTGAFITALIVSLFLLPCTSGPYFVAGGILSNTSWAIAMPLLVLYNLIFIAPMILIIGGLYYGATEIETIKEWREDNIEELHLIAGIILVLLGLFLFFETGALAIP